jgi:hypothetical protein
MRSDAFIAFSGPFFSGGEVHHVAISACQRGLDRNEKLPAVLEADDSAGRDISDGQTGMAIHQSSMSIPKPDGSVHRAVMSVMSELQVSVDSKGTIQGIDSALALRAVNLLEQV